MDVGKAQVPAPWFAKCEDVPVVGQTEINAKVCIWNWYRPLGVQKNLNSVEASELVPVWHRDRRA
jgi:hypothetical protein